MTCLPLSGWRERVVPERAGPVLVAGVLLGLAHPPFHLLVPSLVALVPFIVWHERLPGTDAGRRQARVGGFFLGLVYYTLVFYWLLVALIYYTALAVLAFLVPILILSLLLSWASGAIHLVRRRLGWPAWIVFPAFWTALEWFRANLPQVAFPWMNLGDTLSGFPRLIGAADLVGSRGLSFWLVTIHALIAGLWLARASPGGRRGGRPAVALGLGLGLAATAATPVAYSLVRWSSLELRPAATVGVVQPNVPEHLKLSDRGAAADSAMRATVTLVRPWVGGPELDLVILPEVVIPAYVEPIPSRGHPGSPAADAWATSLADGLDAPVLWGAFGAEDLGDGEYVPYNSAFLTRPSEGRAGRYDKRFLVPVVERVPFLDPDWFASWEHFGNFGVGSWGVPFAFPTGGGEARFGVLICYESIFSPLSRHYRRRGADFLVNITNDAWFGRDEWWSRSSALWQHPAHLVMRAIETRMGAARAANTGISELVDPLGRVSHPTELFESAAFVGEVMTTDARTVYVRWGDVVGWGSVLTAIVALGASILRGRRRSRDAGPDRRREPSGATRHTNTGHDRGA